MGNSLLLSVSMTSGTILPTVLLKLGADLEELAYYLGQITTKGLPATQTAIRYTQITRAHVKEKLKLLKSEASIL